MAKREETEQFLAHYASQYYDPQKAHDYYERTKQLVGRQQASALTSKEQRDTFAVAKDSIATARKTEADSTSAAQKAHVEQLQATAKAAAEKIVADLTAFVQKARNDNAAVKLNPIPKSATPKQRAFLEQQNRILKAKAAKNTNESIQAKNSDATVALKQLSSGMQDAIQTARNNYSQAMLALNAKYNNALTTEKQNIHDQVAGAPTAAQRAAAALAKKKVSAAKKKPAKTYAPVDNSAW